MLGNEADRSPEVRGLGYDHAAIENEVCIIIAPLMVLAVGCTVR